MTCGGLGYRESFGRRDAGKVGISIMTMVIASQVSVVTNSFHCARATIASAIFHFDSGFGHFCLDYFPHFRNIHNAVLHFVHHYKFARSSILRG